MCSEAWIYFVSYSSYFLWLWYGLHLNPLHLGHVPDCLWFFFYLNVGVNSRHRRGAFWMSRRMESASYCALRVLGWTLPGKMWMKQIRLVTTLYSGENDTFVIIKILHVDCWKFGACENNKENYSYPIYPRDNHFKRNYWNFPYLCLYTYVLNDL